MINFVQVEDLPKLVNQTKSFLLDVRDEDEFEAGHFQGSIHIPWEILEEKISGISKNAKLVLYCKTGVRAMKGARMLENMGYKDLNVLLPGYTKGLVNA